MQSTSIFKGMGVIFNIHQCYGFKLLSVATATATADANASTVNKIWFSKEKWQWRAENTRDSLAAKIAYCHRAGGCFLTVSGSPLPFLF